MSTKYRSQPYALFTAFESVRRVGYRRRSLALVIILTLLATTIASSTPVARAGGRYFQVKVVAQSGYNLARVSVVGTNQYNSVATWVWNPATAYEYKPSVEATGWWYDSLHTTSVFADLIINRDAWTRIKSVGCHFSYNQAPNVDWVTVFYWKEGTSIKCKVVNGKL